MRHLRKENQILARKSSFASRNHWANIADGRNWPTLAGPRSAARDPGCVETRWNDNATHDR